MILISLEISSSLSALLEGNAAMASLIRFFIPGNDASASCAIMAIAFELTSVRKIICASISAIFFGSAILNSFQHLADLVMRLVAQPHHLQMSPFSVVAAICLTERNSHA